MKGFLGATCSALAFASMATAAQAETRAYVDVSAGVGASSNPYLQTGTSTGSGAATIEVLPSVEVTSERSTLTIGGAARYEEHFRRYSSDLSGRADASYDYGLSEFTRFRVEAGFASSMGGSRDLLTTSLNGANDPVVNPNADLSGIGIRYRQYDYGTNVRLTSTFSTYNTVQIGGGVQFFDVDSAVARPYRNYNANAGYQRQLSERLTIGPKVSYTKIDYRNVTIGDGEIITSTLDAKYQLSETVSVEASAGAAFASIVQTATTNIKQTGFLGNLLICDTRETTTICVNGSRSVGATALGGISNSWSISGSMSWQLSERDRISAVASHYRTDQFATSALLFGASRNRIVSSTLTYSRQLGERLFLDLSAQHEKVWGQPVARNANFAGVATIRYRFGQ